MKYQKKGAMPLEVIAWAIIVLVVVIVLLLIFFGPSRKAQTYFQDTLDSMGDAACLSQGILSKVSPANDVDNDKRPDKSCDVCVCEGLCPNGKDSNNDNDENGNRIPDGCEDAKDKEDPWYPGCKKGDKANAFEGKSPGSIVVLNKEKKLWQCRPQQAVALPGKEKITTPAQPFQSMQQSANEVITAYIKGLHERLNNAEKKGTLSQEQAAIRSELQDIFKKEFGENELVDGGQYSNYVALNEALLYMQKIYGDTEPGSAKKIVALFPTEFQDDFIARSGPGKRYVLYQDVIDMFPAERWKDPKFRDAMTQRGYKPKSAGT